MQNTIDTHVHTLVSGHSFSTLKEMAIAAAQAGMEAIVLTEHSFLVPGGAPRFMFYNVKNTLPRHEAGVRIYVGVEANIWGHSGEVDVAADALRNLDFVIASLHEVVLTPSTLYNNTRAILNTLANPLVDCVGHPDSAKFPLDLEAVVCAAQRHNKLIEINAGSVALGRAPVGRLEQLIELCCHHGVRMALGSDAHNHSRVGRFDEVLSLLEQAGAPQELIVTRDAAAFSAYLEERQKRVYQYAQSGAIQF